MNVSASVVVLAFAVLSFFVGMVWGVFVSDRNWRRAKRLIHAMHGCTGAMAGEILRLRGLVSSLGGDPGPTPAIVVKRLGRGNGDD